MENVLQHNAIWTLIHDHANATAALGSNIHIVERELKKGNIGEALEWHERSKDHLKKLKDALDTYYIKFKNNFK